MKDPGKKQKLGSVSFIFFLLLEQLRMVWIFFFFFGSVQKWSDLWNHFPSKQVIFAVILALCFIVEAVPVLYFNGTVNFKRWRCISVSRGSLLKYFFLIKRCCTFTNSHIKSFHNRLHYTKIIMMLKITWDSDDGVVKMVSIWKPSA